MVESFEIKNVNITKQDNNKNKAMYDETVAVLNEAVEAYLHIRLSRSLQISFIYRLRINETFCHCV
jgi:hypothetical protein